MVHPKRLERFCVCKTARFAAQLLARSLKNVHRTFFLTLTPLTEFESLEMQRDHRLMR